MTLFIWICYFICGIMLFIINMFLRKKYGIKKFESIIFSLICLVIVGGIFSSYGWSNFNDNLFIIEVFCFVIDIIYTSYFLEKNFFDKNEDNILYYIILIVSGFVLNQEFFNKVEVIFPTGEDLRIILWLLIIVFLYNFFKNYKVFNYDHNHNDLSKPIMSSEYIIMSYAKLRHRFLDDVDYSNKDLELVVFSIMIFENYRCPSFFRKINNIIFRFDSKPRKLGIMQVVSKKFISDVESIDVVYKKLEKIVNGKSKVKNMKDVIDKYDKENSDTINYIYDVVKKFSKK